MYCLKCGKELDGSKKFCPYCGCVTENSDIDTNVSLEENNENSNMKTLTTAATVFGIIGIVMAWLMAIFGYVFAGISLVLSLIAKTKDRTNSKAKKSFILALVAFGCSVISSIIGIIIMTV